MEPLAQTFDQLFKDLLELGFNKIYIGKALQLTNDKEKAVELILKFQDEDEEDKLKRVIINSKNEGQQPIIAQNNSNNMINEINAMNVQNILNNINPQNLMQNEKDKEGEDEWFFPKNDYKMVILVRCDLKMGVGKIAAQVGHAVLGAYKNIFVEKKPKNIEDLEFWEEYGQAKVVLKVNSKEEMLELESKARNIGLNTCVIHDAGRTQIEPGTATVCAIGPAEKTVIDSVTKNLKLL